MDGSWDFVEFIKQQKSGNPKIRKEDNSIIRLVKLKRSPKVREITPHKKGKTVTSPRKKKEKFKNKKRKRNFQNFKNFPKIRNFLKRKILSREDLTNFTNLDPAQQDM